MSEQKIGTQFVGKTNIFTGAKPARKPARNTPKVDVASLVVEDRAYDPDWRIKANKSQYDQIFSTLQVGQCIVCKPDECGAIANGMRAWFRKKGFEIIVKEVSEFPADGKGRVWLYRSREKSPVARAAA